MPSWIQAYCTVSLSLFADPERILRRFYVFAEEPCKSTITTSEPCSPVFKEAQPRASKQSISLISRIGIFMNFIIVHNVFLLLFIYCCNKASNRIVTRSKELVFYSWIPLSLEVSRLSPYTHAQQHTRTSRTFYIFAVHRQPLITPSLVENLMSRGRRRSKFWIVSSRLRPYSDFPKHSRKSCAVLCNANQIQGEVHTHGPQIYKRNR